MAQHYKQITVGRLPESWQHLLLQQAKDQTSSAVGAFTRRTQGWLNRFENMMHSERSDRRAKENAMMEDLGMIQQDVTWKDDKGKEHKLKDVFLESRKEFEEHFQQLDDDASDIKSWIDQPGEGIIQAIPNWQAPQQLTARSSNGGKMVFGGNGLEFYDERSQKLLTGMDSRGKLYADSIEGVKVNAMEIDALLMHGNLQSEDPDGSMKIYIGTQNPGSTLNPWKDGRVIWVKSTNYSSMVSSGQIATTSGARTTRIHPSAITVGYSGNDDMNEVLTQDNFAGHAYYRIKSWVRAWIADWITIRGTKHWIWKGSDNVNMGKLRNLKDQGKNNYTYDPGSNDDWGSDEAGTLDGIDLGSIVLDGDLQAMNQQWQNAFNDLKNSYTNITVPSTPDISTNPGQITTDVDSTSSKAGMLNYTEAYNRGLGPKSGHYTEAVGTMMGGNDGHMYVLKLYTPTGNKHWYRVQ